LVLSKYVNLDQTIRKRRIDEMYTTKRLDGKVIANELEEKIADQVLTASRKPGLAVFLVGDDKASKVYVNRKQKKAQELGFLSMIKEYPKDIPERNLLENIEQLSKCNDIHGMLVQLPLPKHIDPFLVKQAISPNKDVDGFHVQNQGALLLGRPVFVPCTPLGILYLLSCYDVQVEEKNAVVIGRSSIVGKPISLLLLLSNATVSTCHSKTSNLRYYTKNADILVSAVGKANILSKNNTKKGCIVVDVGQNRSSSGALVGDVDFDSMISHASLITPVPGGVGPMTVSLLMWNTLLAFTMIEKPSSIYLPRLGNIHDLLFGHLSIPVAN